MTDERTNPHLEGLPERVMAVLTKHGGWQATLDHIEKLEAALAALPGGGVVLGVPVNTVIVPRGFAVDADALTRGTFQILPTPNPHEADRNG